MYPGFASYGLEKGALRTASGDQDDAGHFNAVNEFLRSLGVRVRNSAWWCSSWWRSRCLR